MSVRKLSEIIGNRDLIRLLTRAVKAGSLPHAVILSGPEGVGKRTVAHSMSALMLCENNEDEFCGHCRQCKLMESDNHPDLKFIEKEEGKSEIGIGAVRELIQAMYKRPYLASCKAFILDGADNMTTEASNAILKVLEEPPSDSYLFLICVNYESLLPTIKSRAQHFKFTGVSVEKIVQYLENIPGITNPRLRAEYSLGSVGRAMEYDDDSGTLVEDINNDFAGLILEGDISSAESLAMKLREDRDRFDTVLRYCYYMLRDLQCVIWDSTSDHIINKQMRETLLKMAENIDRDMLNNLLDRFDNWEKTNKRNLNLRLSAEDFILNLQSIIRA